MYLNKLGLVLVSSRIFPFVIFSFLYRIAFGLISLSPTVLFHGPFLAQSYFVINDTNISSLATYIASLLFMSS